MSGKIRVIVIEANDASEFALRTILDLVRSGARDPMPPTEPLPPIERASSALHTRSLPANGATSAEVAAGGQPALDRILANETHAPRQRRTRTAAPVKRSARGARSGVYEIRGVAGVHSTADAAKQLDCHAMYLAAATRKAGNGNWAKVKGREVRRNASDQEES